MSVHHPAQTARSAPCAPEVYSADEIAQAAGVDGSVIRRLIAAGEVATVDGVFVAEREAARASRRLRREPISTIRPVFGGALLDRELGDSPAGAVSAAMSTLAHGALLPLLVMLTAVQMTTAADRASDTDGPALSRLVFVAEPGPGGGGGGGRVAAAAAAAAGGAPRRQPAPAVPCRRARSPSPWRRSRNRVPPSRWSARRCPGIVAPLMAMRADGRDLRGLLDPPRATTRTASSGPGRDGGVGAGAGRGVGPGSGAGVGPGSGGGAGGGPYRMGSGISPPAIRHEVKPVYTADALRREIEGDVVLEVVVLANGEVGDIRVVRSLSYGLDETAVNAMRQWRFHPARRQGVTVDVVVEVAMEFRLR